MTIWLYIFTKFTKKPLYVQFPVLIPETSVFSGRWKWHFCVCLYFRTTYGLSGRESIPLETSVHQIWNFVFIHGCIAVTMYRYAEMPETKRVCRIR